MSDGLRALEQDVRRCDSRNETILGGSTDIVASQISRPMEVQKRPRENGSATDCGRVIQGPMESDFVGEKASMKGSWGRMHDGAILAC